MMRCHKCGVHFSPLDIVDLEDDDLPICDLCALQGDWYCFTYNGNEVVVCGHNFQEATEKWRSFMHRNHTRIDEGFSPDRFEVRKIEYVITE